MRILHRYILWELAKAFVLALAAVTGLVCLSLVLQALQDKGLGPVACFMYMCLSIPFAMYFAVTLAAVLATTLVYGRLTADREVQACLAGGLAPSSLLWPALVLALAAAGASLGLAAWPMPASHYATKCLARADIERLFFLELATKQRVRDKNKGFQLVVDRIVGDVLYGPTLTHRTRSGQTYAYAPIGKVEFDRKANRINLTLWQAAIISESGEVTIEGTQKGSLELPTHIPRDISDRSLWELLAAQHVPEKFSVALADRDESRDWPPERVRRELDRVRARAMAEFHGRLATALGCLGLVVLGAVLGMAFHSGHLLTAFGAALPPWLGSVLATFMGINVIGDRTQRPEDLLHLVWLPNLAMVAAGGAAAAWIVGWWVRPRRRLLRRTPGP
jgi:lipopolysaccharide export LptBFGC system permease protein LptF